MAQEISCGTPPKSTGTSSLIQDAFVQSARQRVILDPSLLDDEKLPESDRLAVLEQVFHRGIRLKQLQELARYIAPVLGNALPPHLLIYGPSGTGKSVTSLHFMANLRELCTGKGMAFGFYYVDLTSPQTRFGALNAVAMALDARIVNAGREV